MKWDNVCLLHSFGKHSFITLLLKRICRGFEIDVAHNFYMFTEIPSQPWALFEYNEQLEMQLVLEPSSIKHFCSPHEFLHLLNNSLNNLLMCLKSIIENVSCFKYYSIDLEFEGLITCNLLLNLAQFIKFFKKCIPFIWIFALTFYCYQSHRIIFNLLVVKVN